MRRSLAKLAAGRADNVDYIIDCCSTVGAQRAVDVLEELLAGTGATEFICRYAFAFASQQDGKVHVFFALSAYGAEMVSGIYSWLQLVVLAARDT